MLEVSGLSIRAGSFVLNEVSFSVGANQHVVLVGESGAGKSLLLKTIAGLHPAAGGSITLMEREVGGLPTHKRGIPLLHQKPVLFPHLNVRQNILRGFLYGCGRDQIRARMDGDFVKSTAETVGAESLLDRRPSTLSGGEAQRIALARALLNRAPVLLLDEPLSALDVQARTELRGLLQSLRNDDCSFVHVTHDYEEALALATHIGVIGDGKLQQFGACDEVLSEPRSPFLARFSGIRNVIPGTLAQGDPHRVRRFVASDWRASVLTETEGGDGYLLLRSEDVTLARSQTDDSARNHFRGTVVDVVPVVLGHEVIVDVGVPLVAHISHEAAESLKLENGDEVYAGFKATAARFIRSHVASHD